VEYEERIRELDSLQHPKPLADFLYTTFDEFAAVHPWVGKENVRPKSVAREMAENLFSFSEYVKEYGLQREEGVLLRYLFNVYRALVQTVPEKCKTEPLHDLIEWLSVLVRGVDSSLLDEWEILQHVESAKPGDSETLQPIQEKRHDITANKHAFHIAIRNEIWPFIRSLARKDYETAGRNFEPNVKPSLLEAAMEEYWQQHEAILLDSEARSLKYTQLETIDNVFVVRQTLLDPDSDGDWVAEFVVDLEASRAASRPVMTFGRIGGHTL
jgi:hypothetical protein